MRWHLGLCAALLLAGLDRLLQPRREAERLARIDSVEVQRLKRNAIAVLPGNRLVQVQAVRDCDTSVVVRLWTSLPLSLRIF